MSTKYYSKTITLIIIKILFQLFRQNGKTVFLSILILILFYSCQENKTHNIPDYQKFKFLQGDTIIFVSNYNNMYDTFRIGKISISYTSSDKENFEIDDIYYKHIGKLYDSSFLKYSEVHLTTSGAGSSWGDFAGGFFDTDTAKLSIELNGTSFKNVHIVELDTNSVYTRKNIYKTYLCRNYGVLKYYYLNKTVWEFYKAITH